MSQMAWGGEPRVTMGRRGMPRVTKRAGWGGGTEQSDAATMRRHLSLEHVRHRARSDDRLEGGGGTRDVVGLLLGELLAERIEALHLSPLKQRLSQEALDRMEPPRPVDAGRAKAVIASGSKYGVRRQDVRRGGQSEGSSDRVERTPRLRRSPLRRSSQARARPARATQRPSGSRGEGAPRAALDPAP